MPYEAPTDILTETLHQYFGFTTFRDGQERVMRSLLAGRSALAVFPTGGGKSLCYQLPALLLPGLTLVVSPLIALMKDQIDFLTKRGIAAARLDSTLTMDEGRDIEGCMADGTLKLLYVSPERFNNERFLGLLKRTRISLFAVDEAHCISEWGHNFRPDYLKLADTAKSVGIECALALTATATPAVQSDIRETFQIAPGDAVVTGFYRPNLRVATTPVDAARRDELLVARLTARTPGATIVYVTLQKTAERVAAFLAERGLAAWAYHAGMETDARDAVQERWMAAANGIVVATIAFGMGIDKSDVRYVYHYNLPKSLESYSQEIGRAGRDGQSSTVELLACADDIPTLQNFAHGDTPTGASVRGLVDSLFSQGEMLDVNLYDLSQRFDMRPLVLKTALAYLEGAGALRQGTPRYAAYDFKPVGANTPETCADAFTGAAGDLVRQIFAHAKKGTLWRKINPDESAATLGVDRGRLVRALEVMEQRGLIETKAADVRQTYTILIRNPDTDALSADLMAKFERRESGEIARLQQVLDLITHAGCQVNALAAYFGETRAAPCGHCTFCHYRTPRVLPTGADVAVTIPAGFPALRHAHPDALGDARQAARFLCGLSSPALTRAKLTKHALFGSCEAMPFASVMAQIDA